MGYLTTTEMASKWNISSRRIGKLCNENRITGVIKKGKMWLIPEDAKKPEDGRYKANKNARLKK
ncbi:MAG: helix-turn-helix domain-containing protein [Lachnospiraceae bacterium]|nr:helix-turn-helix domain-containing protein [Lachnospiraceae bacterium]